MTDPDEVRRIESALRDAGWASHTSIARQSAIWSALASEVNTYSLTIDDYTNDLCFRDYLAAALAQCAPELRATLEVQLASADTRFRDSTVEDVDRLLTRFYQVKPDAAWWWHRRPAEGPLATYLAHSV